MAQTSTDYPACLYWHAPVIVKNLNGVFFLKQVCAEFGWSEAKDDIKMDCSAYKTCRSCTTKNRCVWSLSLQLCADKENITGSLTVHVGVHCPRFTVVGKPAINDNYEHKIKVRLSAIEYCCYVP